MDIATSTSSMHIKNEHLIPPPTTTPSPDTMQIVNIMTTATTTTTTSSKTNVVNNGNKRERKSRKRKLSEDKVAEKQHSEANEIHATVKHEKEQNNEELKPLKRIQQQNGKNFTPSKTKKNNNSRKRRHSDDEKPVESTTIVQPNNIGSTNNNSSEETNSFKKPQINESQIVDDNNAISLMEGIEHKFLASNDLNVNKSSSQIEQKSINNNTESINNVEFSATTQQQPIDNIYMTDSQTRKRGRRKRDEEVKYSEFSVMTDDGLWVPTDPDKTAAIELLDYYNSIKNQFPKTTRAQLLKIGTYIFDKILTQGFARPFISPENEAAYVYHQYIHKLMDLTTAESNLWSGNYKSPDDIFKDIFQIMFNAFIFHRQPGVIYKEAVEMKKFIKEILDPINHGSIETRMDIIDMKTPYEEFQSISCVNLNSVSKIFIMPFYELYQLNKSQSIMNFKAAERITLYNGPVSEVFNRKNLPEYVLDESATSHNFGRVYVTNKQSQLAELINDKNAILLLLKDIIWNSKTNLLKCKVLVVKPFGKCHDLDPCIFNELKDGRCWVRVVYLYKVDLDLEVTRKFYDTLASARNPFYAREYSHDMLTPEMHQKFMSELNLLNKDDGNEKGIIYGETLAQMTDVDHHYHETIAQKNKEDKNYNIKNMYQNSNNKSATTTSPRFSKRNANNNNNKVQYENKINVFESKDRSKSQTLWEKLVAEAANCNVPIESFNVPDKDIIKIKEGFFKKVYKLKNDKTFVIQSFKDTSNQTLEARLKEVICYLKTFEAPNTGQIRSIYKDPDNDEIEHVFDTYKKITGNQKYKMIHDLVVGMGEIHNSGFAHRDLSEVNLMFTENDDLVVIDFGKAEFTSKDDVKKWAVREVSKERLKLLPKIRATPDHGYKLYRSFATLPRSKSDKSELPNPIDPTKEDIFSIGVLIWRIFSCKIPWGGILDTELKELRKIVSSDKIIKFHVEKHVIGDKSRELLYKALKAKPEDRCNIYELLSYLEENKDELIEEWDVSSRRAIKRTLSI
ncbi:4048_t:CDS:10 [Entrophospora sp. SA101]|nr:4048_t:CDS:10 [Entrophospora sp. SA101]